MPRKAVAHTSRGLAECFWAPFVVAPISILRRWIYRREVYVDAGAVAVPIVAVEPVVMVDVDNINVQVVVAFSTSRDISCRFKQFIKIARSFADFPP